MDRLVAMRGKTVWVVAGTVIVLATVVSLVVLKQGPRATEQAPFFADSTPAVDQTLPASPVALVLNFEQDVAESKRFTLKTEQGQTITTLDEPRIDTLPTTIRRSVTTPLADGAYQIDYEVCFADTTCGAGAVPFRVDSSIVARELAGPEAFVDMRGQPEVTITLDRLAFLPANLRVSPNTKVTWRNLEPVEHYVNTETHPFHTYVLDHNSRALDKDGEFSYTFVQPGAYPYHCSAHAGVMTGMIVVE